MQSGFLRNYKQSQMSNKIVRIERSQVALSNNKALNHLLPAERKIVEAALAPRICEVPREQVEGDLINILITIYTIAGQKADAPTLAIYVQEFYNKVMEVYPRITIEEVRLALRKGVYDEYGEYYGLNVKTFFYFIRQYLESEQRKQAGEAFQNKRKQFAETKTSFEDNVKVSTEYTNELYIRFLNNDLELNFLPGFIFDFLLFKGLISEDLDLKRARIYYSNHIDRDKGCFLHSYMLPDIKEREKEAGIRIVAQQMAVCDYFSLCRSFRVKILVF